MPELSLDKFTSSDVYQVQINNLEHGWFEIGYLTAPLSFSVASSWSASTESSSIASGAPEAIVQSAFGTSTVMWLATSQHWQGCDPVEIAISIGFVATSDAYSEVVQPTKRLLSAPAPPGENRGGVGLTLADAGIILDPPATNTGLGYQVVTKYTTVPHLYPVSATVNYSPTLDSTGHPVSATMDLTFITKRTVTQSEIMSWIN